MKTVLFASGGSGGHLAPAIALAQMCRSLGVQSIISTTSKEVDIRMQSCYENESFIGFSGKPYDGSIKSLVLFLFHLIMALPRILLILKQKGVEQVVVTGGFGCSHVIIAALLLGIPICAHESNSIPGKVTRLFAPFFNHLFVTDLMSDDIRLSANIVRTGFPIREHFTNCGKKEGKLFFGLSSERELITVLGGSQGAMALTKFAESNANVLIEQGYQVFCVTGPGNYVPDSNLEYFRTIPFVEDMGALYAASDIVITRSGAGSIAEIAAHQCPCILVPLPGSADDHQNQNALAFSNRGCAYVCDQDKLYALKDSVVDLLRDKDIKNQMIDSQELWSSNNELGEMIFRIVSDVAWKWV